MPSFYKHTAVLMSYLVGGLMANLFTGVVSAQTASTSRSGGSNSNTTLSYTSPIANYLTFQDEKMSAWKATNDHVKNIGGWRAYAKEAQQPDNTPTPANNNNTKPNPHAGHKGH